MDFKKLEKEIADRLFMCNVLPSFKEAEGHAAVAVSVMKRNLSAAEVVAPVPNQHMKDFSVQRVMREYEYSDTFKHLFASDGTVL